MVAVAGPCRSHRKGNGAMPDTPIEKLTYPCLTDPQQRHWIQDLAEDADRALTRARSDIDYVNNRPKAQIRRPTGTTESCPDNTTLILSYTTVDFDNANPPWANAGAGSLAPHLPGMYYVDLSTRLAPSTLNFPDVYVIEIRYNGITYLSRKWNGAGGNAPLKMAGLIPIATHWPLPILESTITIFGAGGPALFERHRLGLQYLARCAPPLNANPYFEELGVTSWTPQGGGSTFTLNTSNPFRGAGAGRLQGSTGAAVWSDAVPVTVGKRYIAQLYSRRFALNDQNHSIAIRWLDGAMALVSTSTGANQSTTTSYQLWEVSAIAPATTAFAQIAFTHTGADPAIDTLIDDATIQAGCA